MKYMSKKSCGFVAVAVVIAFISIVVVNRIASQVKLQRQNARNHYEALVRTSFTLSVLSVFIKQGIARNDVPNCLSNEKATAWIGYTKETWEMFANNPDISDLDRSIAEVNGRLMVVDGWGREIIIVSHNSVPVAILSMGADGKVDPLESYRDDIIWYIDRNLGGDIYVVDGIRSVTGTRQSAEIDNGNQTK